MKHRAWLITTGFVAAFALASVFDRAVLGALHHPDVQHAEWYKILRVVGDVRVWMIVSVVFFAAELRWRRDTLIWAGPVLAGLLAELGKLLVGRERPVDGGIIQNDGHYVWKEGLLGGFADSGNLGLPSSHAAVAFGGAAALSMLFPRVWMVVVPLACGCAVTRLLSGAHFVSDVVAGAAVGVLGAAIMRRVLRVSTIRGKQP